MKTKMNHKKAGRPRKIETQRNFTIRVHDSIRKEFIAKVHEIRNELILRKQTTIK